MSETSRPKHMNSLNFIACFYQSHLRRNSDRREFHKVSAACFLRCSNFLPGRVNGAMWKLETNNHNMLDQMNLTQALGRAKMLQNNRKKFSVVSVYGLENDSPRADLKFAKLWRTFVQIHRIIWLTFMLVVALTTNSFCSKCSNLKSILFPIRVKSTAPWRQVQVECNDFRLL